MWFAVMAFVVGVVGLPSHAATINVASSEVLLTPGNGKCSLREAILNAEGGTDVSAGDCTAGTSGNDTISLAANSIYVLPDRDPYPLDVLLNDRETSGLPEMHTQLTIDGNGATIQRDPAAANCFRIFYVSRLGNVSLNNMTLQNGCVNLTDAAGVHGAGGAIFNRGTLSLDTVTIANNSATRSGGAIHNDGTLTLMRSTVRNNTVTTGAPAGAGGGIVNRGAMQVFQSTISGNSTTGAAALSMPASSLRAARAMAPEKPRSPIPR
jgi:predicted outer membrane repeat protein